MLLLESSWIWVQLPDCFALALLGLIFSHGRALPLPLGLDDSAFCIGSNREKAVWDHLM